MRPFFLEYNMKLKLYTILFKRKVLALIAKIFIRIMNVYIKIKSRR